MPQVTRDRHLLAGDDHASDRAARAYCGEGPAHHQAGERPPSCHRERAPCVHLPWRTRPYPGAPTARHLDRWAQDRQTTLPRSARSSSTSSGGLLRARNRRHREQGDSDGVPVTVPPCARRSVGRLLREPSATRAWRERARL